MLDRPAKHLVISLHDVSPRTREECARALAELREWGVEKCSLLVIPDHHGRGHFLEDAAFCEWLTELTGAGHEVVIHGSQHRRERRAGEGLADRLTTRFYTADEGEFFDLDRPSAHALVSKAREDFNKIGLAPTGFIAPAWLLSEEAEAALRELGIDYTTRLGSVRDLQNGRTMWSQSLVWSVRAGWRRAMSRAWNSWLFSRLGECPLMRISIHPVDVAHPALWAQIGDLTRRALASREPLTYAAWIESQRQLSSIFR